MPLRRWGWGCRERDQQTKCLSLTRRHRQQHPVRERWPLPDPPRSRDNSEQQVYMYAAAKAPLQIPHCKCPTAKAHNAQLKKIQRQLKTQAAHTCCFRPAWTSIVTFWTKKKHECSLCSPVDTRQRITTTSLVLQLRASGIMSDTQAKFGLEHVDGECRDVVRPQNQHQAACRRRGHRTGPLSSLLVAQASTPHTQATHHRAAVAFL